MRVRNQPSATADQSQCFLDLLDRSIQSFDLWHSEHPLQAEKISALQNDIRLLRQQARTQDFTHAYPWNALYEWATDHVGTEAQECLASLMLEPYADLVDGLDLCMSSPDSGIFRIDGSMSVGALSDMIQENYSWALSIDWSEPGNAARAWYVSEEKLEPRLGERFEEPIADYEQPLAPARDIAALYEAIKNVQADKLTAEFLMEQPAHRYAVRRVQLCAKAPYAEIRDNTISSELIPFDMLRCKLSFFGATHFDPRSDRWLRICLYANAPYPEELADGDADTWVYPTLYAVT